jgi:stage III sporulation protein AF
MEALKELVRSLAAIIILTSLMEMVLPNSKMKSYVRLMLGLFVIVIILNPVLAFLGSSGEFSSQAWIEPARDQQLEEIMADAQDLSVQSRDMFLDDYAAKVEQQIAALVMLSPEVREAQVEVLIAEEDPDLGTDIIGAIREVNLRVRLKDAGDIPESDSPQGNAGNVDASGAHTERRIQSIVSDFYGLMPDQVSVTVEQ